MAKLVDEGADAVDGLAVIVAAVQLVEHGKVVDVRVANIGTEGAIAAARVVLGGIQRPVAGPDGLGVVTRCLGLAHTGKDDDHHVAVVVVVGVVGLERHAVGSCQLAGLGNQPADALVLGAGGATAVVLAVLGQAIDAIHVKHGLVHAVGLVVEVLAHALVAREHRFDDLIGGVIELLVLKLHQDDGNAAFAQGGHIGGGIAAVSPVSDEM